MSVCFNKNLDNIEDAGQTVLKSIIGAKLQSENRWFEEAGKLLCNKEAMEILLKEAVSLVSLNGTHMSRFMHKTPH